MGGRRAAGRRAEPGGARRRTSSFARRGRRRSSSRAASCEPTAASTSRIPTPATWATWRPSRRAWPCGPDARWWRGRQTAKTSPWPSLLAGVTRRLDRGHRDELVARAAGSGLVAALGRGGGAAELAHGERSRPRSSRPSLRAVALFGTRGCPRRSPAGCRTWAAMSAGQTPPARRSPTRTSRCSSGWRTGRPGLRMFDEHPWLGVGIGNYGGELRPLPAAALVRAAGPRSQRVHQLRGGDGRAWAWPHSCSSGSASPSSRSRWAGRGPDGSAPRRSAFLEHGPT